MAKKDDEIEQLLDQILEILGSQGGIGEGGKPEDALKELSKAKKLAQRLPKPASDFFGGIIEANRLNVSGLALRKDKNIDEALNHFNQALGHTQKVKEEYPDWAKKFEEPLRKQEFGIKLQINTIEVDKAHRNGADPKEVKAMRRRSIDKVIKFMSDDDPNRPFFVAILMLDDASDKFRESGTELGKMNLEYAVKYIEEAKLLAQNAQEAIRDADYASTMVPRECFVGLFRGFEELLGAQAAFVRALRDAVIGEVTEGHVAELDSAYDRLREGLRSIEQAVTVNREQFGDIASGFDLDSLGQSIKSQQEVIRNLRQLIKTGLRPRELALRSSPRFFIYFILTFIVVLVGSRWSGLVTEIGGGDITAILGIALVVSATASFGYRAGLNFASGIVGRLRSKRQSD